MVGIGTTTQATKQEGGKEAIDHEGTLDGGLATARGEEEHHIGILAV